MKRVVFYSCIFLLFFGCSVKYIPLPDKLWEIECEPYDIAENCCVHKSAKYANLLLSAGIEAYVVVGTVHTDTPHAWVVAVNPETGRLHTIDPTWPDNRDGYVDRHRVVWAQFNPGVTGEDVRSYRGVAEIYLENIPTKHHWYFRGIKDERIAIFSDKEGSKD